MKSFAFEDCLSSSGIWRRLVWRKFTEVFLEHAAWLKSSCTLKMKVLYFSETLVVFCHIALHCLLQDCDVFSHHSEKFQSRNLVCVSLERDFTPLLLLHELRTELAAHVLVCILHVHVMHFRLPYCVFLSLLLLSQVCNMNRVFSVALFGKLI